MLSNNNLLRIGAGALTLLASAALNAATPRYDCVQMQSPTNGRPWSNGINNSGAIVGTDATVSFDTIHAMVWNENHGTELANPDTFAYSFAKGVNDTGSVVGYAHRYGGPDEAAVWENGTPSILPLLPDAVGSYANSINNHGEIVGDNQFISRDGPHQAALWLNKSPQALEGLNNKPGLQSLARAINNRSEIVGYSGVSPDDSHLRAVYWAADTRQISKLPSLRKGWKAVAHDINDFGKIAGASQYDEATPEVCHAVIWNERHKPVDLGALPGGNSSYAVSINNGGAVVGSSRISSSNNYKDQRAVVWPRSGATAVDLNTRLRGAGCVDASGVPFVLLYATGINDSGVIAADGEPIDLTDHRRSVFRLTPRQ